MRLKGLIPVFITALAMLIAAALPSRAAPLSIVGFGDSLMAGYQLPQNEGFTAKLEQALKAKGHDVTVTNAGVSGDTTSGGLARIDWSVPDGTRGVILELGANDALRGIAPEETRKNLVAMLEKLKARNIPSSSLECCRRRTWAAIMPTGSTPSIPIWRKPMASSSTRFFLDGVVENAGLKLEDGMHPNAKGVDQMVARMLPSVERFLQRLGS